MTKLSAFDCDDCRDCIHRRIFDNGVAWCRLNMIYCPQNGCEFGSNKKAYHIDE